MSTITTSFLVGAVVGIVFTLMRLPLPAPNAFAGVVGILGVYAGMVLIKAIF
jgi:XapX domain-containing protein